MLNDCKPKLMLTETMEDKLKSLNTIDKENITQPFDFGHNYKSKNNKFELIKKGLVKEDSTIIKNKKIFYQKVRANPVKSMREKIEIEK